MAGATVYQLELTPIAEEDAMTEAHAFDTPFYNSIADYVYETDDRAATESFLADSLSKLNKSRELVTIARSTNGCIETITFAEGVREAYFTEAYTEFTRQLALLSASHTFAAFVEGKLELPLFSLECAYDDKYGDYVFTNGCEFLTFDEFIRTVRTDVHYYLGGIMNYHY